MRGLHVGFAFSWRDGYAQLNLLNGVWWNISGGNSTRWVILYIGTEISDSRYLFSSFCLWLCVVFDYLSPRLNGQQSRYLLSLTFMFRCLRGWCRVTGSIGLLTANFSNGHFWQKKNAALLLLPTQFGGKRRRRRRRFCKTTPLEQLPMSTALQMMWKIVSKWRPKSPFSATPQKIFQLFIDWLHFWINCDRNEIQWRHRYFIIEYGNGGQWYDWMI